MGSGDWFRTIITRIKAKQSKSRLTEGKSEGIKGKGKECRRISNGSSSKKARSRELTAEAAAMKIQTAFRAYTARKALRRLKGIVRCRHVMKEICIENQPTVALNHIHFWTKIQAEIKARRLYMVTLGRLQQKRLETKLKLEAKLQELEEEWCGGSETMEEILQRIQHREEAAVKRERAMAYAFSHQWRANSGSYFGRAYYDLGKESWGWSWKERWIAVRPWETRVEVKSTTTTTTTTNSKRIVQSKKVVDKSGKGTMKIILTVQKPSQNSNGKGLIQERKLAEAVEEEKQAAIFIQ